MSKRVALPREVANIVLTGFCKEEFEKLICRHLENKYYEKISDEELAIEWIYASNELIQFAHYVEYFDMIGIYVTVKRSKGLFHSVVNGHQSVKGFEDRLEAIQEGLREANEDRNKELVKIKKSE